MNYTRKTFALAQKAVRHLSSTETVSPRFYKLKEAQKKFGIEDNVPVHIKGGAVDKILYGITCVVTFVGVGMSFQTFYDLIKK